MSIEPPQLTADTAGTIQEARRLHRAVGRPNVMIKVVATEDGVRAVEALIAEGLNINITLIFSLGHYEAVAAAYIRGLQRCATPARVASVASFFLCQPEVFQNICRFLEVTPEFSPDMAHRYLQAQVPRFAATGWFKRSGLWAAVASVTPARLRPFIRRALIRPPGATHMDPADRGYLVDFYREDIPKLESLLGPSLEGWLRQDSEASSGGSHRDRTGEPQSTT